MNPVVVEEQQLPPQQPQPHRISTSCDRHPDEHFTGFCPSCLCERLAVLDQSASASTTAIPARKSASAAIKSIFRSATGNNQNPNPVGERPTFRTRPGSFLPELRRTKSFSGSGGGRGDGGGIFEPQRKSCDVRGRSTLWTLFNQDDVKRVGSSANPKKTNNNNEASSASCSSSRVGVEQQQQSREVKFNYTDQRSSLVIELEEGKETVSEIVEEEEEEEISQQLYRRKVADTSEIEEVEEPISSNLSSGNPKYSGEGEQLGEILETVEREEEVENFVEVKPMKDHIDLHSASQSKKPSGGGNGSGKVAGSFWSAASVFSKKLRSWAKKNNNHNGSKMGKKHGGGDGHSRLARALGKKRHGGGGRSYRETQSEIADYGFGRRSCDTDPRFSVDAGRMSLDYGRMSLDAGRMSLDAGRMSYDAGRMSVDAGRMSFDDPRYSFDEPRASWDGYLIGGVLGRSSTSSFPRMPPMVSVVEDPHPHPPPPSHLSHMSSHHHHPPPPPPPVTTVTRKDSLIPLEEQFQLPRNSTCSTLEEEQSGGAVPGGALQTKDYYSDSSSRRRKSLDRSSSIRKTAAMVVAEMDEMKSSSNGGGNAKVTPATAADCGACNVGGRVSFSGEKDLLRDPNINNTLRGGVVGVGDDYYSGSFDMGWRGSGIDNGASVVGVGNEERKVGNSGKKSRRWRSWNIWGMIIRRGSNKEEDEDGRYRPNGVERSFSESWGELGGRDAAYVAAAAGDPRVGLNNRGMFRSNSSVSWRSSYSNSNGGGGGGNGGLFNGSGGNGSSSLRRNGGGGGHAKKKSNEFVLERNRSGRHSPPPPPTHSDNSLLRFYLTPLRGSRRGAPGKTKPSAAYSHAIARSVLRMY